MSVDDLFSGMSMNKTLPVTVPNTNSGISSVQRKKQQEEDKKREEEIRQAGKDGFIQGLQTEALNKIEGIGIEEKDYVFSPLNVKLRRGELEYKLEVILNNLTIPSDYKGQYYIPFPEYKDELVSPEYVSGRYQTGPTTKIRYEQQPEALAYYEFEPELNIKEYGEAIKVKETTRETKIPQVKIVGEEEKVVPGENIFKYKPTPTVRNILRKLQEIYKLITKDKVEVIPKEYLPTKEVETKNGFKTLYINDKLLNASLIDFIATLNVTGLAQSIEKLDTKSSFVESYLTIKTEKDLLNHILGEGNWTIEISQSYNIKVKKAKRKEKKEKKDAKKKEEQEQEQEQEQDMIVTRAYYLDMLGNFRYGQLVSDSSSNFKNDVQRSAIMKGFLKRIILADVFRVFEALGEKDTKEIDALKKRIENEGKAKGQERWQKFELERKQHDAELKKIEYECQKIEAETKLLEMWSQGEEKSQLQICGSRPMKLLENILPENVKRIEPVKRTADERLEEEEQHFTKRKIAVSSVDDDFKDITISKPKGPKEEETKEE